MRVRTVELSDSADIAAIYNYYVQNFHATFELDPIDSSEMRTRIDEILSAGFPFVICEEDGEIEGYAYGKQFRPRAAYKHSIETSVYVKNGCEGKGIGTVLYTHLLNKIRSSDFHAVIAGISLPNEASVRLHEKLGFQKVAHFREVGFKFDRWIDVGYWQLQIPTNPS